MDFLDKKWTKNYGKFLRSGCYRGPWRAQKRWLIVSDPTLIGQALFTPIWVDDGNRARVLVWSIDNRGLQLTVIILGDSLWVGQFFCNKI